MEPTVTTMEILAWSWPELSKQGQMIYVLLLAGLSLLTFVLYGFDKTQAKTSGARVPESTLHGLALLGGWAGGWAGRKVFRHKKRKPLFAVVLTLATLIHGYLIYRWFL
jgi:uncharacterized membrane protein YsdA (DUF1294 family)